MPLVRFPTRAPRQRAPTAACKRAPNAACKRAPNAACKRAPNAACKRAPNAACQRAPNAACKRAPNAACKRAPDRAATARERCPKLLSCLCLLLLSLTSLLANPLPRVGNTFSLPFPDGSGQIEWVSPSTFRFTRNWTGPVPFKTASLKALPIEVGESSTSYSFKSKYLRVEVEKTGNGITVRAGSRDVLLDARVRQGVLEQRAGAGERFYGLGARQAARFDLRGSLVETRDGFLLSSAGFAEYFPACGACRFELAHARPDTVEVSVPEERIEFVFHYGPTPKEVFEEHLAVMPRPERFGAADFVVREARGSAAPGTWETLAGTIRSLLHASLSAEFLIPEFDLSPYRKADPDLRARAAQVACLMPVLRAPVEQASGPSLRWRERFEPYLLSYTKEVQDRGIPVIRPLEVDSQEDPAALNRSAEFKLGDELLVAPVLNPSGPVAVYLPRGEWTDLATGQTYRGRQEIRISPQPGRIPIFAKNGTIVPLMPESGDILELHYFAGSDLGAEFFLFEEEDDDISQFHAAPAADLTRLEIESRTDRVYDWVIHRPGAVRKVEAGGTEYTSVAAPSRLKPGCWHFDPARKLLRIRIHSAPGGDEVLHVTN